MKKYYFNKSRDVAIFLCCVFCFFSVEAQVNIDWQTFLAKQDPVWETLPQKFDHGAFLGNGLLGTTIFQDAPQQLRFEIGRSDVTDHRRDNGRLPIGGLLLKTVGKIQSGTLRTDLWNAEVRGEIITDRGAVKFRALNHAKEIALIVDFDFEGDEKDAVFQWEPKEAAVLRDKIKNANIEANPQAESGRDGDLSYCEQKRIAGGSYTSAWRLNSEGPGKKRLTFTVADDFPGDRSKREALKTVERVAKIPVSTLEKSHRQWWHDYYPESFVSVPDSQIEGFYWNQIYKLASATRRERMVIDLLGPWYRETGWPRIWWNLNIQLAYSPVYAANRLELGESFTRFIDAKRDNFVKNAKDIWKFDDCATTPHTTDYEGLRGDGTAAQDGYINPGDFTWALHLYWQQYRFSMDKSLVTNHKKHAFYPLLKQSVNLYLKLLKKGDDGKLHLPKFHSPEYGDDEDNNYNLSLLRWACGTLLYLDGRYGFKDPMRPEWERVMRDLVDYPQDENGFRIGKNIAFKHSHRHWSHILMVWPLHVLSPERQADREAVVKSVKHWLTVEDAKGINGWSLAAASAMHSCLGDGDNALRCLRAHHNSKVSVMPNTQYIEGAPVIECSLVAAQSLQEMLMQSWGDVIRIFPAAPSEWKEIAFQDLRAEGAFLVTASRKNGRTAWIRIKSLAGEPCRVKPDFKDTFKLSDASVAVRETEAGVFELSLKKGQEVTLYQNENDVKPVAPVAIPQEKANFWGVKNAPVNNE
ncbi:MAG: alpha-L-fucosidase [Tannerella sp.]|nr:alpha-L-fucosidase [Tannerella sp.]